MQAWRLGLAAILGILIVWPLAMPIADLVAYPEGFRALADGAQLFTLARNTLALILGALVLSVPFGVVLSLLLYRTNLPGRNLLKGLILLTLFIPLPFFASGWQSALGSGGWMDLLFQSKASSSNADGQITGASWSPWALGLSYASWIHGLVALPWIVFLTGQGLSSVERELEEEAVMLGSPWRALRFITFPRAAASIAAALLFVSLQTANEIGVADMMQVRTFAEEVYNQLTRPAATVSLPVGLASALAVNIPSIIVCWMITSLFVHYLGRRLAPVQRINSLTPMVFNLGWSRWPLAGVCLVGVGFLLAVPLGSLIWKTGYRPGHLWNAGVLGHHLATVIHIRGFLIGKSLIMAAAAGFVAATLALLASWLARESRTLRAFLIGIVISVLVIPGPIQGLGLKKTILALVDWSHLQLVGDLLYFGTSPVPVLWAYLLRFFPVAMALLWPVVRLMPPEWFDASRSMRAGPLREFCAVVWTPARPAWLRAQVAVGILCLGELSASKLVETPGSQTFAHEIFTQMHYGVTNDVAALCLWMMIAVSLATGGFRLLASKPPGWLLVGKHSYNQSP